ncbi:MAG: GAF domain-containing protein [Thermoflexales bacterium]|nr:GAF domain-containing protein [Thermoflexales bacterium]
MPRQGIRPDLLFLSRLLSRWREHYIWRVAALAEMASVPAAALGFYYIAATAVLTAEQTLALIALVAVLVIAANLSGLLYAWRSTRLLREALWRKDGLPAEKEEAIWHEATAFPWRFARFAFVNTVLIVVVPGIVLGYAVIGIRSSNIPYFLIGGLVATTWIAVYYYFALEWLLWPVRQEVLIRSSSVHHRYLAGPGIQTRMLFVYAALALTTLLMIGTLAYRKSEQALAPGANPVLVLQEMHRHILLLSLVSLFISVGFSVLLARLIANPIQRLTATMAEVERGDLSRRGELVSTDETGRLTIAFNEMVSRLQALHTGLEDQVAARTAELARRTAQLEAAAYVARRAAEFRDVDALLNEAVRLISDRFGFYHAGIFLLDERGEYAVLQAASSEGGQRMLTRGHRLKVGQVGIVGYVAGIGEPRIALDVGEDAVFFDNPDLPLTRSEMALPLKVGERIIGVLDVQSEEPAAFTQEDVAVLQTMADQIALAVENARTLEQMERTVRELERVYGEYTREAWQAVRRARRWVGRRYRRLAPEPAEELPEEARRALAEGRPVLQPVYAEGDGRAVGTLLAVPVKLRGQVIGALNLRFATPEVPPEAVRMVEEIADRLALALENARLLEETRRHAERDRRIAEITARVRASMDPEAVLRTAARELGAVLGVDRVVVQMIPGTRIAGEPPAQPE